MRLKNEWAQDKTRTTIERVYQNMYVPRTSHDIYRNVPALDEDLYDIYNKLQRRCYSSLHLKIKPKQRLRVRVQNNYLRQERYHIEEK